MAKANYWEEREVKVSAEDKAALTEHIEAINKIVEKYPFYKVADCNVVTTMCRVKNTASELAKLIKVLLVEEKKEG